MTMPLAMVSFEFGPGRAALALALALMSAAAAIAFGRAAPASGPGGGRILAGPAAPAVGRRRYLARRPSAPSAAPATP